MIGTNLSEADALTLSRGHVLADSEQYQDAASTARHAMSREGQTAEEARAESNKFVRNQFERAWNAPTRTDALIEFTLALHALQDSTSPSHANFQQWTGHESFEEKHMHVMPELINPGRGSNLYEATREAWKWFNDRRLPSGDLFHFGCDGCQQRTPKVIM